MACQTCVKASPSQRLRIVRTILNVDQEPFYSYIKVSQSTYSAWENRRVEFREKHRERLRTAGISPLYIEYGTEEPFSQNKTIEKVRRYILDQFERDNAEEIEVIV